MSHNTEVNVSILKGFFDQYIELYQWSKNRVTKKKLKLSVCGRSVKFARCVYSSYFPLIFCCCSSITPVFDGSTWTLLNGAPAKYEDPLDDDVCIDVSELLHWLMYSMITDVE
jgi:hypothetical protein